MGDSLGLASLLRDFVDVLIPGEGPWPSASMVGVQGVLAMRLLEAQGEAGADELERALLEYGGPLAPLDAGPGRRWCGSSRPPSLRCSSSRATRPTSPTTNIPRSSVLFKGLGQPYQAMPGCQGLSVAGVRPGA